MLEHVVCFLELTHILTYLYIFLIVFPTAKLLKGNIAWSKNDSMQQWYLQLSRRSFWWQHPWQTIWDIWDMIFLDQDPTHKLQGNLLDPSLVQAEFNINTVSIQWNSLVASWERSTKKKNKVGPYCQLKMEFRGPINGLINKKLIFLVFLMLFHPDKWIYLGYYLCLVFRGLPWMIDPANTSGARPSLSP